MSDDLRPSKRGKRTRKREPGRPNKNVPLEEKKPPPEVPLWVERPVCSGAGPTVQHDCVCTQGFVKTGYTQERLDREVSRGDKYLMALAAYAEYPDAPDTLRRLVETKKKELEAARSRTKPLS